MLLLWSVTQGGGHWGFQACVFYTDTIWYSSSISADLDSNVTRFEHGADVDTEMKSPQTTELITEHWYSRLQFSLLLLLLLLCQWLERTERRRATSWCWTMFRRVQWCTNCQHAVWCQTWFDFRRVNVWWLLYLHASHQCYIWLYNNVTQSVAEVPRGTFCGATEIAGQENAGLENDGQICRGGKCRTEIDGQKLQGVENDGHGIKW